MYTKLAIITLNVACCYCFAAYELFKGFDVTENISSTTSSTISSGSTNVKNKLTTSAPATETVNIHKNKNIIRLNQNHTISTVSPISTFINGSLNISKFECPEEEPPSNIGPYEIPTQRDFVLQVRKTLLRMFDSYHKKALFFLKDIKEATRAATEIEKKCPVVSRATYKQCVKHVGNQCELLTKILVTSLENQRHEVAAFTEGKVCNLSAVKADPVQLIKVLAMEEISLEFALPGFLRLLNACSTYCSKSSVTVNSQKPPRHMTDQDLVKMTESRKLNALTMNTAAMINGAFTSFAYHPLDGGSILEL